MLARINIALRISLAVCVVTGLLLAMIAIWAPLSDDLLSKITWTWGVLFAFVFLVRIATDTDLPKSK